jgi:hypothetical protein
VRSAPSGRCQAGLLAQDISRDRLPIPAAPVQWHCDRGIKRPSQRRVRVGISPTSLRRDARTVRGRSGHVGRLATSQPTLYRRSAARTRTRRRGAGGGGVGRCEGFSPGRAGEIFFHTEPRRARRAAQTLRTATGGPSRTCCNLHSSTSTSTAALSTSTRSKELPRTLCSAFSPCLCVSVRGFSGVSRTEKSLTAPPGGGARRRLAGPAMATRRRALARGFLVVAILEVRV